MINRKIYQRPNVEMVALDNEVSLTLDSSVPWDDPELFSVTELSIGGMVGPELL
jgi:hypothetical protein